MELPVEQPDRVLTRPTTDVRAMAIAVQANLVQLKLAEVKRSGVGSAAIDIKVPSPGAVLEYRDALIDREAIKLFSDQELHLKLHETWGRFCLFGWALSEADPTPCQNFARLPEGAELHCEAALQAKGAEIRALLWRMRYEWRSRLEPDFETSAFCRLHREQAETIPATHQGRPITELVVEEILLASCEYGGMLSTVRWILDRNAAWDHPDLADPGDDPF